MIVLVRPPIHSSDPVGGVGLLLCGPAVVVTIPHAIQGFDGLEVFIDLPELLPKPFDMAVDRPVVDVDMIAICRVDQLFPVLTCPGREAND